MALFCDFEIRRFDIRPVLEHLLFKEGIVDNESLLRPGPVLTIPPKKDASRVSCAYAP
ncbi:hypothetical protein BGLT_04722 [Caballeronia glathei]|jgi:hypothetical protein|nr:hypothetical protein B0G84_5937 [Paraburkholderia sp. BL8N3]CDY75818.1 hypothetical protein BGLT_04722 [Caballeronia glathei]